MKVDLEKVQILKNDLTNDVYEYYADSDLLSVDCEMMGLNPIRDRLCLVQMCDKTEKITLVKIEERGNSPNLKKLFEDSKIKKIFHFARADLSFLYHYLGISLANIFCTRSASKLVRTYTDKHGLKELLKELLNIEIDKNNQQTNWGNTELTKDQIKYAASDVIYLIPAYEKLTELLKRENRLELMEECNKVIFTLSKLDLLGYVDFFAH